MKNKYTKELSVAKRIALKAGKIILKYADDQDITIKKDNSFVTVADKLINTLVIKELKKFFPKDIVLGEEESTGDYGMGRRWICDPIDGTAAYVWGVPTSLFSLAFVVDGVAVIGVTYDPYLKLLYSGVKGGKSFCNKKVLKVSNLKLESGIFAMTGSTKEIGSQKYFKELKDRKVRLASFSGAVYKCMLISRARLVGYIEERLYPHDIAASQVILECAGGKVTGVKGERLDYSKPFRGAVASNGVVHDELLRFVSMDNDIDFL